MTTETTPPALPFTRRPGRTPPLGVQRWDWHFWAVYALCASPIAVQEVRAILINARQRREVAAGLRATVDYCHRTITECVTAVFAFHPDTRTGPYAKLRRVLLVWVLAWLVVHFLGDGEIA